VSERTPPKNKVSRILDYAALESFNDLNNGDEGQVESFTRFLNIFFESTPEHIKKLKTAAQSKDSHTLRQVAHALKSNCGYMGAYRMTDLCARIEELGQSGECLDAPALVSLLQMEYKKVQKALEEYRNSLKIA
jgi:HPt (histidine-containing phosphotransfer) domain-containing protein